MDDLSKEEILAMLLKKRDYAQQQRLKLEAEEVQRVEEMAAGFESEFLLMRKNAEYVGTYLSHEDSGMRALSVEVLHTFYRNDHSLDLALEWMCANDTSFEVRKRAIRCLALRHRDARDERMVRFLEEVGRNNAELQGDCQLAIDYINGRDLLEMVRALVDRGKDTSGE
jgi:hypothetical protein